MKATFLMLLIINKWEVWLVRTEKKHKKNIYPLKKVRKQLEAQMSFCIIAVLCFRVQHNFCSFSKVRGISKHQELKSESQSEVKNFSIFVENLLVLVLLLRWLLKFFVSFHFAFSMHDFCLSNSWKCHKILHL